MSYATLAGELVENARVFVSGVGPWFADIRLVGDGVVQGSAALKLGELELRGTVAERFSGTFGLRRSLRFVAGGGGWGSLLPAKAYHNDAGVRARVVVEDAAREAGELLGAVDVGLDRVGVDYVRQAGPASRALEDVIGSLSWWVDYSGRTNVGVRRPVFAPAGSYQVLEHDPRSRLITLAVDDLAQIIVGSVIADRIDTPQTVRELEISVTEESARVKVWCGQDTTGRGRVAGALRSIVERIVDERLHGLWRYRVVRMSPGDPSTRVELQAVSLAAGLPDVLPVSMWPGLAGASADLTPGSLVLVEFVEGDRRMPVVTHFQGADGVDFVPVRLTLGGTSGPNAARRGDSVRVTIPAGTFLVTANAGVLNAGPVDVDGEITEGSDKVGIA